MNDGLKELYRKKIVNILSTAPGIERVVLFGSRAMGTYTTSSDVDLALFGDDLTLDDLSKLSEKIERLSMPQRVDLVLHHRIENKKLIKHIQKHGVEWFKSATSGNEKTGFVDRPDNIYGELPKGWTLVTINRLCHEGEADIQTGPFGTMLHAHLYRDQGTPVVAVKNIGDNRLIVDDIPRVDDETCARLSRYRLCKGDIIFGRKGAVNRRAFIHADQEGWLQGSDCIRLRLFERKTISRYISYVLGSPHYRNWIEQNAQGATMPSLNQEIVGRIPVPLAPRPEQRAISHILGTLDDKIELNRRMNETLEEMARAIFKSWFVDFDPVRAKAEGRDTGLSKQIADLFPDSFEESELGEIPKGWEISSVGQHFLLTMGQSPPGSTYNEAENGLPFYQGRTDFGFRFPSRRIFCSSPTRIAEVGDTLVSVRAPVGDVNVASERCAIGRGVAAIRHCSGKRSFTYYSMHHLAGHFEKFEAEGTVFGAINKKDFERLPFINPSPEILTIFDQIVSPLDNRIENNERQSSVIASLRNALLPKLISGELLVKDAEQFVGRLSIWP